MKKIILYLMFPIFLSASYKEDLIKAVKEDNLIAVKTLYKAEYGREIKDPIMDKNLLAIAIEKGANNVAKYLIQKDKLLINEIAKDGHSPLLDAIQRRNIEIIKYLLEHGATIRFNNGTDVYKQAINYGMGDVVKILRDFELSQGK